MGGHGGRESRAGSQGCRGRWARRTEGGDWQAESPGRVPRVLRAPPCTPAVPRTAPAPSPWGFLQEAGGTGMSKAAGAGPTHPRPPCCVPGQKASVGRARGLGRPPPALTMGGLGEWGRPPPALTMGGMGGMAAARCFSCFRSSGFWGEALALASPVGVRRLGRGDSSLRGRQASGPWLTAGRPHPPPLPGWSPERRRRGGTSQHHRGGGSSFSPLAHAGP